MIKVCSRNMCVGTGERRLRGLVVGGTLAGSEGKGRRRRRIKERAGHPAAASRGASPASCSLRRQLLRSLCFPGVPWRPQFKEDVRVGARLAATLSPSSLRRRFHSLFAEDSRRAAGVKVVAVEARVPKSVTAATDLMLSATAGCHLRAATCHFLSFFATRSCATTGAESARNTDMEESASPRNLREIHANAFAIKS